jgi:hypothetical protein
MSAAGRMPRRARAMSFRTTDALAERLHDAANESGRSLTQEIELRLEASFQRDAIGTVLDRIEQRIVALAKGRRQ